MDIDPKLHRRPALHGERKQRRNISITDTGWDALGDLANLMGVSRQEVIEIIVRRKFDTEQYRTICAFLLLPLIWPKHTKNFFPYPIDFRIIGGVYLGKKETNNHLQIMSTYNISFNPETSVLSVGFGEPSTNDQIVKDAVAGIKAIKEQLQGHVLRVNGAASLPVGFALCAEVAHVTCAVAVFDPKLQKYVVAVSHDPNFTVGDLI